MSTRHDLNQIELVGDEFVLNCECGWRSPSSRNAAAVGAAWDEHRRSAPA